MRDYSSAKIELLALKWLICEKFKDYLLGSKFMVYTDNNPLVYVKSSKLGAVQIHWLSKLVLYNFNIVYHVGESNLFTDALSRHSDLSSDLNINGSMTVMMSGKQCLIQLHTPDRFLMNMGKSPVKYF